MSMGDICLDSENWADLCGLVTAAGIDLETLARETGAIRRRRSVRDAETLLRLGLAYGGGLGSLQTLSAWRVPDSIGSRPLRLIDASCISKPGSKGTDWRLHAVFDPTRQCFGDLDLSDAKG